MHPDKRGIARYGSTMLPMDDSLCTAAVIFAEGEPCIQLQPAAGLRRGFETENIRNSLGFCKQFRNHPALNLMYGENAHHNAECIFKAAARALKEALLMGQQAGNAFHKGCL
jgi:imidazoleglycerol-phosphate dehydratase